jgi:hypothetical protein
MRRRLFLGSYKLRQDIARGRDNVARAAAHAAPVQATTCAPSRARGSLAHRTSLLSRRHTLKLNRAFFAVCQGYNEIRKPLRRQLAAHRIRESV